MNFLPLLFQLVGFALGGPWGALAGALIGMVLFGTMSGSQEGPRIKDLKVQSSAFGAPIPLTWGSVRLAANIFWSPGIKEVVRKTKQGAGILGGGMEITTYEYFFSGAFALSDARIGPISTVTRIWANSILIYDARNGGVMSLPTGGWTLSIYTGSDTQMPDPYIEANRFGYGVPGSAPAYRRTAYIVLKNVPLLTYGNQVPQFEFEVIRGTPSTPRIEYLDMAAGQQTPHMENGNFAIDFEREIIWTIDNLTTINTAFGVDPYTFTNAYKVEVPNVSSIAQHDRITAGTDFQPELLAGNNFGWTEDLRTGLRLTEKTGDSSFMSPCLPTFDAMNREWKVYGGNGLWTGVERTRSRVHPYPWDSGVSLHYPESLSWYAYLGVSTAGGYRLPRATQEAWPNVGAEYLAASWKFYCGSALGANRAFYYLKLYGTPTGPEETSEGPSGLLFSKELWEQWDPMPSSGLGPTIAHDRTRDRLWMSHQEGAGGTATARKAHIRYLDFAIMDGYSPAQWTTFTCPEIEAIDAAFNPAIFYNPDLDYLIILWEQNGQQGIHALCFNCDRASLASPAPVYTFFHDFGPSSYNTPAGVSGWSGISRGDWVVFKPPVASGLSKVYLGIGYSDSACQLSIIVRDICRLCGLEDADFDVTELTDMVQGYAVARPSTGRQAIEPLMGAYYFDGVETGGG